MQPTSPDGVPTQKAKRASPARYTFVEVDGDEEDYSGTEREDDYDDEPDREDQYDITREILADGNVVTSAGRPEPVNRDLLREVVADKMRCEVSKIRFLSSGS